MVACALATGTVFARLSDEGLSRLGCAPADAWSWRAGCQLTSLPFTWGGPSFLGLLPLVAFSLGTCERAFGTRRTTAIFLATHLVAGWVETGALLGLSGVLGGETTASLLTAPDVGPSAGCFGCLGAVIARLAPRQRLGAATALALFLLAISAWRPDPGFAPTTLWLSDLAHPIAAGAGYAAGRWLRSESRSGEPRSDG